MKREGGPLSTSLRRRQKLLRRSCLLSCCLLGFDAWALHVLGRRWPDHLPPWTLPSARQPQSPPTLARPRQRWTSFRNTLAGKPRTSAHVRSVNIDLKFCPEASAEQCFPFPGRSSQNKGGFQEPCPPSLHPAAVAAAGPSSSESRRHLRVPADASHLRAVSASPTVAPGWQEWTVEPTH